MPTIHVPGALRGFTANAATIAVTGATVRAALAALEQRHPGIVAKVLDGETVKPFVRIYVGPDDIGALGGLDTPLAGDAEISIIPALAGGR